MVNIICMKWGTKYGPEYVNTLQRMVARNLTRSHRFICFTDDASGLDASVVALLLPPCNVPAGRPAIEAWRKIGLFNAALPVEGTSLFLDLDLVITGPLDAFFDVPFVSERIDALIGLTWWPADFCKSFIKHCLPEGPLKWFRRSRIPHGCRVLVFHGSPNPPEAAHHWRYGRRKLLRPFKLMRPAPWIRDYWN